MAISKRPRRHEVKSYEDALRQVVADSWRVRRELQRKAEHAAVPEYVGLTFTLSAVNCQLRALFDVRRNAMGREWG